MKLSYVVMIFVDCQVTQWEAWTVCDTDCGPGTMTRKRSISIQPHNGGKHCPSLEQRRGCQVSNCHLHPDPAIKEDLSKEDQYINKISRLFLNKTILAGKKAIIRNNKLIIDDKAYNHEFLLHNPNINFEEEESSIENNTAKDGKSRVEPEETFKRKGNFEEKPNDTDTRRNTQRKQQNGPN
ncbi:hypothetical protein JTB14_036170 [Gonioctena quinquepunctata]|nr:hypothetical protein JTB14_036170 [Gonioctena quinquepunctata]